MNLENLSLMCNIVASVVSKLGFTKYRRHDTPEKSIFLFALSNQGISTEDNWKTFPVMIEVETSFIKVKTIFSFKNQAFTFDDQNLLTTVQEFITRANLWLKIGCFKFNSCKRHLFYESQAMYSLLNQDCWASIVTPLLSYNISTYKSYIYGVVRLVEAFEQGLNYQWDLKKLIRLCERRPNSLDFPRPQEPRRIEFNSDKMSGSDSSTSSVSVESMEDGNSTLNDENFEQELTILQRLQENEVLCSVILQEGLSIDRKNKEFLYENNNYLGFAEVFTNSECPYDYLDAARKICTKLIEQGFSVIKFPCLQLIVLKDEPNPENAVKLKVRYLHRVIQAQQVPPQTVILDLLVQQFISQIKLYKFRRMFEWSGDDYILSSVLDYQDAKNQQLLIGNGGFCQIYRNSMCGMEVAVKIMKAKEDANKSNLKRLKKEYWMLKTLQHPNILRCLGYSKYKSKYCLVLERCQNGSLNQYLRNNCLTLSQKLTISFILAGAIEYIHYKGICHFDIKPQNVLLNEHLEPKLCDFGLSEMVENDQYPGYTLLYSSPEQMMGNSPQFPADVWAFGMTLYYTFTKLTPFYELIAGNQKLSKHELYEQLENKVIPKIPQSLYNDCPKLVEILKSCWRFDPEQRPGMRNIRQKLREIIQS